MLVLEPAGSRGDGEAARAGAGSCSLAPGMEVNQPVLPSVVLSLG